MRTRAYLKGTLGNKCVVLVLLKNYGRSSNKSWTRNSRVFRQLLSYQLLPYLLFFPSGKYMKYKKNNVPEAAISFQQRTASLLCAGGRSERERTKTSKSLSTRRLQALGRTQQAAREGAQTSSSHHNCLHLCLSEEKLNYLTLENKGEKRAC